LNTFFLIKAHKTLLSIAVLFFFIGQPILSSIVVSGQITAIVIDIDNDSEKETKDKNKQEKELSEEKKITSNHGQLAIVFLNSNSRKIAPFQNAFFGSVFLEISNPPPEVFL
tara:strand:- start:191 stop:526 length:336 start_codon:yes stop_codon:yes gene_type:complete